MTTNAFLFSWDCTGVEAIIPITHYEDWDTVNAFGVLQGKGKTSNPLNQTLNMLCMRARFNPQRFYEIYAIDCDPSLTEEFWREEWETSPQMCADLIRSKGVKIYSDRMPADTVKIR